jgi:hypothetical protein
MNIGIVYFIQPAELIGTNHYKVGFSRNTKLERLISGYKNGSRYIIILECNEPYMLEMTIKKEFKKKFILIAGTEYFKGDEEIMAQEFIKLKFEHDILLKTKNISSTPIINNNVSNIEHLYSEIGICNYLRNLTNSKSKHSLLSSQNKLYQYDGKLWHNDDKLLRNFMSGDLYENLKGDLVKTYSEHKMFSKMMNQIKKLKTECFRKRIITLYTENYNEKSIEFDNNPYLLGFNNTVYDLNTDSFREYKYDDYMSFTTGYDWQEPTQEEINIITQQINKIMPDKEEQNLYLQILSSSLSGICLEKLIIQNGENTDKRFMNDLLLLALGKDYSAIGDNILLFQNNKENINKKRLVIFRNVPKKQQLCMNNMRDLISKNIFTEKGIIDTKKCYTIMLEFDKKPVFDTYPSSRDIQKIIDIQFTAPETNVNLDNSRNKYALLKILMDVYKKYKQNKYELKISETIEKRSQSYKELTCNLVEWFKDNYEFTNDKNDICKLKDLYTDLTTSVYFLNLTKTEKQKYNKAYFTEFIQTDIFFVKYYKTRTSICINFISQWRKKISLPVDNKINI